MWDRTLPDGWRRVRFGDVVHEVRQATKDPAADGLTRVVGLEHLDSGSLSLRRWNELDDLADGTSFTRSFHAGQVLFGKRRAYQRKVAVPDFDGICSSDILVLEPSTQELLADFLPHLAQSDGFFDHALGTSAGSLSPRTKFYDLMKYEFALPPPSEQRSIADVLATAAQAREEYLRVQRAASDIRDALRSSSIAADMDGPTRPLGDVVGMDMGRVYPSPEYGDSGIRLLRPGNIAPGGLLDWSDSTTVCLPERYAKERGAVLLAPGDVVMNMTAQSLEDGFLGRVCIAQASDESIVNQRIARLRSGRISSAYLFLVLQDSRFRRHVERSAKGSKIKHLYWQDLSSFEVPLPSPERAAEVVARVDAANRVTRAARESAIAIHRSTRALSNELLRGNRRVQ